MFQKGHKKSGGKVKGTEHPVTIDTRNNFKMIVEGQTENINKALNKLLKTNPKAFIDCLVNLSEYFLPKLQRTEVIDETQAQINIIIEKHYDAKELNKNGT